MPTPRDKRRARWIRGVGAGVVLAAAAVLLAPYAEVARGTDAASKCLAAYRAPRGPEHPDCAPTIAPFVTPSRVPWTAHVASYRAEELYARMVSYDYVDAAVGKPDRAALARAAKALDEQGEAIRRQSQRVVLEELGPAMLAPELGKDADEIGDRKTLVEQGQRWLEWPVRMHTLEDAVMDGGLEAALPIARHYASWDPRDEEVRFMIAAFLCLGGEAQRGLNFLKLLQNDRASERHENFTRDYGDVRWLVAACAKSADVPEIPKPLRTDAGRADQSEARMVMALEVLSQRGATDPAPLYDEVHRAMEMLGEARTPGMRAVLVTAVAGSGYASLNAAQVAKMATPREQEGEGPLVSSSPITALDWLAEPRGPSAALRGAFAKKAALSLEDVARAEGATDEGKATRVAAAAAWLVAARSFALEGDADASVAAIDAAKDALPDVSLRALARSSARLLGGDRDGALAELHQVAEDASASVRAAAALQRAEILASKGDREGAARAAITADDLAKDTGDRKLDLRARWTRLALAPNDPLRSGDAALAARASDRAPRFFPWLAPAEAPKEEWPTPPEVGATRVARAMFDWNAARTSSPDERRAFRYAALAHRGDVPFAYPEFVSILGDLISDDEGDRSLWLDAATAFDPRVVTLRLYAFSRAEAARWRGDVSEAKAWQERYDVLRALIANEKTADLARAIGI